MEWSQPLRIVQSILNLTIPPEAPSPKTVDLLVLYDASGNHDAAYFRTLGRLVRSKYDKSVRIRAHIAQDRKDKPRCPARFARRVRRAIGSRLETVSAFRYHSEQRLEKCTRHCTGSFDAYYLDSTTLAELNANIARIAGAYPGTMAMLRRMGDVTNVFTIARRNEPDSPLTRLLTAHWVNEHLKSIPPEFLHAEDATQPIMSDADKCSVIMFSNRLA